MVVHDPGQVNHAELSALCTWVAVVINSMWDQGFAMSWNGVPWPHMVWISSKSGYCSSVGSCDM